jgi:formyltetrahydrofolate synthetase
MNAAAKVQVLGAGALILGSIYALTNFKSPTVKFVNDMSFNREPDIHNQLFLKVAAEDTATHVKDTTTYAAFPGNTDDMTHPDNSLTLQASDGEQIVLLYKKNTPIGQKTADVLNEVYGTGHDPHIRTLKVDKW